MSALRGKRTWYGLAGAVLAFGVLAGVVWVADGPRELVLPIWLGAMLGLAGTGYWKKRSWFGRKVHPDRRKSENVASSR
jgi:hypothetical protein